MNAEEIKKRLRSKNVNFTPPSQEVEKKKEKEVEPVLPERRHEVESERVDHTELFSPSDSEDVEP